MSTSTVNFLLFFLGVCVLLAGVGAWLGLHDMDYGYAYDRTTDEYPQYAEGNVTTTAYYDELTDRDRRFVDRAMAGEKFHFETEGGVPPTLVKRDGSYHVFNAYGYFDWLDSRTFLSTATALFGLGLIVWTARRDMG